MKTIVLGYHDVGCLGIRKLAEHGFDILAVFTHTDDPEEQCWFESVAELAASMNLLVFTPNNINHPIWVSKIEELQPDVIFSFYYRYMIKEPILSIPPAGCLNLHPSLLPAYRGRAPVNWVLVNGEMETGATLHYMTPRPDDGDIVNQKTIVIDPDDTALLLHRKAALAAAEILDESLPLIKAGTAPRRPQDPARASYYGRRRPEDGEIDWRLSAERIRNLVRAVTRPYPGAFSHTGDRKCLFWQVSTVPAGEGAEPGQVLSTDPLVIACGKGAIRIDYGQAGDGDFTTGAQLAGELGLAKMMVFDRARGSGVGRARKNES